MVTQTGVTPTVSGERTRAIQSGEASRDNPVHGDGVTYYIDALNGSDGRSGRFRNEPFATMAKTFTVIKSGDTIRFSGKIREQLVAPLKVFDITIIGEGNRPRHADAAPIPAGGSSANTWTTPASGATTAPLLELKQQGWRFENVLFAGPSDESCIELVRTAEGADEEDASHASFYGCRFASGKWGIHDLGGCAGVRVEDCFFAALTTFAIEGVGNIGVGQVEWTLKGNRFLGFTGGVKIAALHCVIEDNYFTDGGTPATTVVLNTVNASGGNNFVAKNFFQTTTANFNSPDIEGNATDVWAQNASIDSTSAGVGGNFEWGQPA